MNEKEKASLNHQDKSLQEDDTEKKSTENESPEKNSSRTFFSSLSEKFEQGKQAFQDRADSFNEELQQATVYTDNTLKNIRSRATLFEMITRPAKWKNLYSDYQAKRQKEKEDLNVYGILFSGASPSIEYYMLTILSCVIATTGLIQGSTAVIIGAMIVAPLMTPILASSLGVIWGDLNLMRMSIFSLIKGAVLTVLISSLLAYIIPLTSYSDEIISRTIPSLFDILVALASGCVGAYGYANKKINNTLVGIAIAVALMPPLCTIGIGLGTMNSQIAIGATILFLINYISISLAGAVVFLIMRIHPLAEETGTVIRRATSQIILSLILLTAIAIPIGSFMYNGFRLAHIETEIRQFVKDQPGKMAVISINSEISKLEYRQLRYTYTMEVVITAPSAPNYRSFNSFIDEIYGSEIIDNVKMNFLPSTLIE
ncbi:MAG: TIGR00341 family protein [Spirochaetes bacterium]|jgi:uncharacterized hydrophobic protein (TIGR00271 family)|nr:TIGR00341 family protein [Spirochaetota bacterium]